VSPNLLEISKTEPQTEKCRLSSPKIFSSPENFATVAVENTGNYYLLVEIRNLSFGCSLFL